MKSTEICQLNLLGTRRQFVGSCTPLVSLPACLVFRQSKDTATVTAHVLAVSIFDVEDEKDARQDDAEHRQHSHQYEKPDGDDTRSYLLGDGVWRRNVICTYAQQQQQRRRSLSFCFLFVFKLKPGFHYPSWRPELTARVDGWPVTQAVLTGARFH